MGKRNRAKAALEALVRHRVSLRYRVESVGKRVKWYGYQLGREGQLCRTPQQAVEAFVREFTEETRP